VENLEKLTEMERANRLEKGSCHAVDDGLKRELTPSGWR
jgi:hypothetical protein